MKKITIIAAVAFASTLLLPSCKKDFTCTSTYAGQTASAQMKNVKKSDAKKACEGMTEQYKILDMGVKCELK